MKITNWRPSQYKNGTPQRVMVTIVGTITIWLRGKKVKRKQSFTRHLRQVPYSNRYLGKGLFSDELVTFAEYGGGNFTSLLNVPALNAKAS